MSATVVEMGKQAPEEKTWSHHFFFSHGDLRTGSDEQQRRLRITVGSKIAQEHVFRSAAFP